MNSIQLEAETPAKNITMPSSSEMAAVFGALSNSARIDILRYIAKHRHCGCKEITEVLPLAQSTISQHLKGTDRSENRCCGGRAAAIQV